MSPPRDKPPLIFRMNRLARLSLILALVAGLLQAAPPTVPDAAATKIRLLSDALQARDSGDLPAAREVLKAAAYTYVAVALSTLLDIVRWVRMLKF